MNGDKLPIENFEIHGCCYCVLVYLKLMRFLSTVDAFFMQYHHNYVSGCSEKYFRNFSSK